MWLLLLCRSSRILRMRSLLLFSGCLVCLCLVFLSPVFVDEKLSVFLCGIVIIIAYTYKLNDFCVG